MNLSRGMQISLGVHFVLLLLVAFGLPAFFDAQRENEPVVISVEILPVTDKTNVKPSSSSKAPAPKITEAKEQPDPVEKPKEAPTPPKPTPTPTPPKPPEPSPRELVSPDAPKVEEKKKEPEKPKEEPKPVVKKEEPKKEKEKPVEESMEDVLKRIAKESKSPQAKPTTKPADKEAAPAKDTSTKANTSTQYDDSLPMGMSEIDSIVSQIQRCWSVPAGARDADNLQILLNVRLNQDGSVQSVSHAGSSARYATDSFYKAAADSAMRAVRKCSPLQGLPAEKFNRWQELELNFDPRNML